MKAKGKSQKTVAESSDFDAVFARLRTILQSHSRGFTVAKDLPGEYCLEGGLHPTHQVPMQIAWIKIGKGYVSYHLMPVYCAPRLMEKTSPELKKRMQGKACFNFKSIDEPLFAELDQLTSNGLDAMKKSDLFSGKKSK